MDYILASMDDDIAKVSELLILLAHNKVHWVHSSYSPLTPWGGGGATEKKRKSLTLSLVSVMPSSTVPPSVALT